MGVVPRDLVRALPHMEGTRYCRTVAVKSRPGYTRTIHRFPRRLIRKIHLRAARVGRNRRRFFLALPEDVHLDAYMHPLCIYRIYLYMEQRFDGCAWNLVSSTFRSHTFPRD